MNKNNISNIVKIEISRGIIYSFQKGKDRYEVFWEDMFDGVEPDNCVGHEGESKWETQYFIRKNSIDRTSRYNQEQLEVIHDKIGKEYALKEDNIDEVLEDPGELKVEEISK